MGLRGGCLRGVSGESFQKQVPDRTTVLVWSAHEV